MLINHQMLTTSPSMRLLLSAPNADALLGVSIEGGGRDVTGTTVPTYDVRVPAFPMGGAFPGVRAWSPPV